MAISAAIRASGFHYIICLAKAPPTLPKSASIRHHVFRKFPRMKGIVIPKYEVHFELDSTLLHMMDAVSSANPYSA